MEDEKDEGKFEMQISPIDQLYYYIDCKIELEPELSKMLVHQTYFFFVIELRTGIKPQDLSKISNYFLTLCQDIIDKDLRGISFVINGKHYVIKNHSIPVIKQLFAQTFVISKQDDYSKTLVQTRHAVQSVSQKLNETNVTILFFFSHIEIDHSLGVKKRSYIDYLNEHADLCREEVEKLAKTVKKFTDRCYTYIISYDKEGEEDTDYSLCDTDLMNQISVFVGNTGTINRNYSYNQLNSAFEEASAMMLFKMYTLNLLLPVFENKTTFARFHELIALTCENTKQFSGKPIYIQKQLLDGAKLREKGLQLLKYRDRSGNQDENDFQAQLKTYILSPKVNYCQLSVSQLLVARTKVGCLQINKICRVLANKIVQYKRKYEGGKSFIDMSFDKDLYLSMRDKLQFYYDISKQIFTTIQGGGFKGKEQFELYEAYNEFKRKIDRTREVLVDILKKQIGGSEIGKLSQVISLSSIKNSLKNKLLKRINANPFLLDQVYNQVTNIVDHGGINFPQLQADFSDVYSRLGNCVISDLNFARAMMNYDALGVAFEIQRPMSAIADPGRIKIRQISPSLMSVSSFFNKFLYKIEYTPQTVELVLQRCKHCKKYCDYQGDCEYRILNHLEETKVHKYKTEVKKIESLNQWNENVSRNDFKPNQVDKQEGYFRVKKQVDFLRDVGDLQKQNYQEKWDYTNRVELTQSVIGFMPLFLAQEHWRVAKLLMKPCLAFTATGQPLGYMFSQYQTIPFMVLSAVIRTCKQLEYALQQQLQKAQKAQSQQQLNKFQTLINSRKKRISRLHYIQQAIETTCKNIMHELSSQNYQTPLIGQVRQLYQNYKEPINRTVDVISNNSAFLGQIYTAFRFQFMEKPSEEEFHYFFVRMVEEELRRQTDGWVQEQTQDAFVNKILNLNAEKIRKNQNNIIVLTDEDYSQKFYQALQGLRMQEDTIKVHKQELEMMLRQGGKFNDNQRLLIIEYQRMYINKVMWMWYVRFLLYTTRERIFIHRWKSLGIINSTMLFALIIQNKKQTKNYKRRQAITEGRYADPFDYYKAREYLEEEFTTLYNKIVDQMTKEVEYKRGKDAAEVFIATGSLQQAAGVLLNANNLIPSLYRALLHHGIPRFSEKMSMLVHGKYRGVKITKWIPSRRKTNLLRQIHKHEFERYQYMI